MRTLRERAGPILELTSEWAQGDKQLGNRTEALLQDAHQTTERGVHTAEAGTMRPRAAHERLPHIVMMLALALFGCGGSGNRQPTGPSIGPTPTPAAPAPEFRDGWTEQSLPAEIAPSAPKMGDGVIVRAPGYLAREAHFRGEPFFLWPAEEGYVRQVIYTSTNGLPAAMRRYDRSSIVITPDGEIGSDPAVMEVLQKVAAESSRATGIPISVGPNGQVHVIVDGSQPLSRTTPPPPSRRTSASS